jgi:hypothetical protein
MTKRSPCIMCDGGRQICICHKAWPMTDQKAYPLDKRAPKLYTMFLPPSHPFWQMSDDEFERYAGVHVRREIVKPIPIGEIGQQEKA